MMTSHFDTGHKAKYYGYKNCKSTTNENVKLRLIIFLPPLLLLHPSRETAYITQLCNICIRGRYVGTRVVVEVACNSVPNFAARSTKIHVQIKHFQTKARVEACSSCLFEDLTKFLPVIGRQLSLGTDTCFVTNNIFCIFVAFIWPKNIDAITVKVLVATRPRINTPVGPS